MLKFIDLFAGIGGFRIALENLGFKCVFSAEINKHACLIYKTNFNTDPYKTSEKPTPLGVGWIAQKIKKCMLLL